MSTFGRLIHVARRTFARAESPSGPRGPEVPEAAARSLLVQPPRRPVPSLWDDGRELPVMAILGGHSSWLSEVAENVILQARDDRDIDVLTCANALRAHDGLAPLLGPTLVYKDQALPNPQTPGSARVAVFSWQMDRAFVEWVQAWTWARRHSRHIVVLEQSWVASPADVEGPLNEIIRRAPARQCGLILTADLNRWMGLAFHSAVGAVLLAQHGCVGHLGPFGDPLLESQLKSLGDRELLLLDLERGGARARCSVPRGVFGTVSEARR